MIPQINNIADVKIFAKELVAEGANFHPDDDFFSYVQQGTESKPSYSIQEATLRNTLMGQCFEVCQKEGQDIYDTMLEVFLIETGMEVFIPLPSRL